MGVECASCGQIIPSGQLRCGNCGAVQTGDSFEDYGGLTEVPPHHEALHALNSGADSSPPSATAATGTAPGPGAQLPAPTATLVVPPAGSAAIPPVVAPVLSGLAAPAAAPASPVSAPRVPAPADDDEAVREPAVPRGTFASEVPDRGAAGEEREAAVRVVTPEREPLPPKAQPRAAAITSSQRLKTVRPPVRPPYLASEILREDLTPSEPGRRHINVVLHAAPALGAVAVLTSGIDRIATWAALAALSGLFILTRFELSYHTLAVLVASIGGLCLAATSCARVAMGGGFDGPLLATVATLLPAALLFRTWYRAAYTARVLVSLALVLAVMWATWTSHRGLLALEFDWQSWVPALTWYLFGILCLLSLLAFMSGETTGGCDVWALGISVWYGLFACGRFAIEERGVQIPNFQTLGLLEPALAAPTAVALAQLFSGFFGTQKMKS
ncbi:MAG: hypothetical protein JWN48_2978 [Myxococcaceae bacterium]|nr:hypothetical protein [Myxococcaceae bacterium]